MLAPSKSEAVPAGCLRADPTDVSFCATQRWRQPGELAFFLWCLRREAGLPVTLKAAVGGVERDAAAVVVVAATSAALAGLASSAGVSSNSGCFCVRDQLDSYHQPLEVSSLEPSGRTQLLFGRDAPGPRLSRPSWPASWA